MLKTKFVFSKRFFVVLFIMLLSIFSLFILGCKNNTNDDTGLNVKSSDGDSFPAHIVVHYKTEKRYLNIGEDLNVSVSFGKIRDYNNVDYYEIRSSTAELIMRRVKWNTQLTHYEIVDIQDLKKIDDFSTNEYKGTFKSDKNVLNVTIPSEWFNDSFDSFVFMLNVREEFVKDEVEDIYDGGVGASLYFRIIEDKIKLYGSFYDFKNDK